MFQQKLNFTRDGYLGILRLEDVTVEVLAEEARGVFGIPHLHSAGPTRLHAVRRHPHREGGCQRHRALELRANRLPTCGA